ncbi:MAG: hypothetical protein JST92_20830 [Deltaproteobacteria bacterium]|nr:hypothetical protein [Deltaproteobacteria bacterium]
MSRDKLKALEELQALDLQIRELTLQAEKHPQRLKVIESEKASAKGVLDGIRGRLADNERARRQQQELLGVEKDKVRKWESRLSELKTPREYAALARELEIAKKTNTNAEGEINRLAAEYEDLKKQATAAEGVLAEKDTVLSREGTEIKAILDGIQAQMKVLEESRGKATGAVERSLLSKYERIRKQRGGIAVVGVVRGTCKGCQMNIPPQMANTLRTATEIMSCPSCNRFIYNADPIEVPATA